MKKNLTQSLITGLFLANLTWWLYALSDAVTKWRVVFLVLAVGALLTWLLLQIPRRQVLRSSGTVRRESSLRLALNWNDGHTGSFSHHQITQDQFIAWCIGVDAGLSLGETHWSGNGAQFSKPAYILFRDQLLSRGFIRKRGHYTRGFELTAKGVAMCREVVRRFAPTHTQSAHGHADPIPILNLRE